MGDTVLTQSTEKSATAYTSMRRGLFRGRSGQRRREALLAYALLLPAFTIIFTFGLFPLAFALYESTLRGLNRIVGRYDGLGNYVRAIDNLAYVLGFWIAVVFVILAIRQLSETRELENRHGDQPMVWLVPGAVMGAGLALFARFVFTLLPEVLGIPDQLPRGQGLTRELFLQLLADVWRLEVVQSGLRWSMLVLILAVVLAYVANRIRVTSVRRSRYYAGYLQASLLLLGAAALSWVTWLEIQRAYVEALEEGVSLDLWSQVLTISAGLVLLALSWLLWRSASFRDSNLSTFFRLGSAAAVAVGAWVLIAELPLAVAEGDKDWWQGLLATVFYSAGSIPLQLSISLVLATFMFQDIRGKTIWRMIFFLPYIAPTVGTAAAFRIIFSARVTGPINSILSSLGLQSLGWLIEPKGIIQMIAGEGVDLPAFLAGPSLALGVIILYGVWSFVGFNIVIFLAGLGNIPRTLYEAASIDGGGRWAQFRHITLPMLSPSIYFLVLLSVIGTFKAFNHIWVLRLGAALGTTDTASVVIFQAFNRDTRYGYASALAILLLIIVVILTVVNNRIASRRVFYG